MVLIIGLVFGVIWGSCCARMATRVNRSSGGYFALGFFLGLIGVVITYFVTRSDRRAQDLRHLGVPAGPIPSNARDRQQAIDNPWGTAA